MTKVLVTGANGQLGRCLRDVAKEFPELYFDFKDSKDLDITNKSNIEDFFPSQAYDYCINCAAYTAVDKAEQESDKAFLVNGEAVKYLAYACNKNEVVFIHISTDFVFDGTKKDPYTEEDEPNPISVYGASKLKGEQYVQEILDNYFIVRTSWVYSEYGNNFVKTMLRLAEERDEINVVGDQIGSPTYAGDLAKFLIFLINTKSQKFGTYHYSNDGEISWYDFAIEIFSLAKRSVKVNKIKTRDFKLAALRPTYSSLSGEKILNFLNYERIFWKMAIVKVLEGKKL
ncbi:dTDP-4-dehydrorhamnose reductase [Galbibacter mesophilus]|uniref:dTDP-4-dehydrorhamnose reductase n=1 Tax=Galbibacter mesophilus TaxID=379069 RepID=UPI00191D7A8E|nr:dTDP-4-dehydrorhamnose reductase [Galbibacter mesophilus]MCM5663492.1 dTDP-4-dehydrorhamnose reductase [Galbibacter mesophilus]